jgi:hypothetical protein
MRVRHTVQQQPGTTQTATGVGLGPGPPRICALEPGSKQRLAANKGQQQACKPCLEQMQLQTSIGLPGEAPPQLVTAAAAASSELSPML